MNRCPVCRGPEHDFEACLRDMRNKERAEGQLEIVFGLKCWAATLSAPLCDEMLKTLRELSLELEKERHAEFTMKVSDVVAEKRKIETEVLLQARDAVCPGCARASSKPHRCLALPIRRIIFRIDPQEYFAVSPKDWCPGPHHDAAP